VDPQYWLRRLEHGRSDRSDEQLPTWGHILEALATPAIALRAVMIAASQWRPSHKLPSANTYEIADYSVTYDTTYLENAVFTNLKAGKLASTAFWKGSRAYDTDGRIISCTAAIVG
jgi:hypothetical protein